MPDQPRPTPDDGVDLYWLPLGAGDALPTVRWSGRLFEVVAARAHRRRPRDLYHSALAVRLDGHRFVIEMAPVWRCTAPDRGVVCEGPVGLPWLGRSRWFRYEVHAWRDGVIPDESEAVSSPRLVSSDRNRAAAVLELLPSFPAATWGRDELGAGEMWNSNSLVSWLLACSGHDLTAVPLPSGGRAPGWTAGRVVAEQQPGLSRLVP